ncbi:MAG: mannose-6-phosphate isomerase, class I [Candidatus Cloacimonetes bacterium]|jgi:mannose-6-phosphate isomerase|nr:mannose-6-phosphate isomerase, class I [Candidatus Cloacimonadota bacterium]
MNKSDEPRIFKLRNQIRNYDWGSKTFIFNLLGREEPSPEPQAELWMGTHTQAPSRILSNGREESLLEVIRQNPMRILGESVARKFENELPFLFKVLAAAHPLSIQAHPNKAQARKGFKLENKKNIPLNSPERNYKDNNHKPELLCALTNFEVMCGFQPIKNIVERIKYLQLEDHIPRMKELEIDPTAKNLKKMFSDLMGKHYDDQTKKVGILVNKIAESKPRDENETLIYRWIVRLAAIYPKDMGVFSPLFLNIMKLKPGEAFFIEAGVLHTYLSGCGLEIMANSDNVLRGGLTHKKVDIPGLIKMLKFDKAGLKKIQPKFNKGEYIYQTSAEEFQLSKIIVKDNEPFVRSNISSAEIILCIEGTGSITWSDSSLELKQGESIFIPFAVSEYSIEGSTELFRVVVPTG